MFLLPQLAISYIVSASSSVTAVPEGANVAFSQRSALGHAVIVAITAVSNAILKGSAANNFTRVAAKALTCQSPPSVDRLTVGACRPHAATEADQKAE